MKNFGIICCFALTAAVLSLASTSSSHADKVRVGEDSGNTCVAVGSTVTCTSPTGGVGTYTGCSAHRYGGWMCNSVKIAPDGTVTLIPAKERTVSN